MEINVDAQLEED